MLTVRRYDMNYRIGLPFWKIAYKFGFTLIFRVVIHKDNENKVYWCKSPDLPGLIAKMPTIEELIKEVNIIAEELLELNYNLKPRHTKFYFLNNMKRLA